ncbi:MAG: hypothetical protein ACFFBH_14010 [Promethearchaeota archaeon]
MSKRLLLRVSVILLALGIGLVPPAYLINGYMQDQVNAEIPRTILIIRHGFANYLEVNFIGLGVPDVLEKIRFQQIPSLGDDTIADFLLMLNSYPYFLDLIKNSILLKLPEMINGSKTVQIMNQTIFTVMNQTSQNEVQVRNLFFNNYNFQSNYLAPIEGISEYGLGNISLNFTATAQSRILYGFGTYRGLFTDPDFGSGLQNWLNFYDLAKANLTDRALMESIYNCTWSSGQLQNVSNYIRNYMWDNVIKSTYAPKTIETYALETFYGQWANYSFYHNRLDLQRFIDPLSSVLTGFEAAINYLTPTNISLTSCENLWDAANSLSFLNQGGLLKWFQTYHGDIESLNELTSTFGLTDDQVGTVLSWLFGVAPTWRVRYVIIPRLIQLPKPYGFDTAYNTYMFNLFYEQWANGTVVQNGISLSLTDVIKGFEAGIPTSTNISRSIAESLFNINNASSFVSKIGIFTWVQAYYGNITWQNDLMNVFNLSSSQLNLLLNWLFNKFKENLVPFLVLPLVGETLNQLAFDDFPKQWAYGTYSKESIDLTNYSSSGFSYLGWELGITTDLNLNITQITDLSKFREFPSNYPPLGLLDSSNSLSFVNRKGISKWLRSIEFPEYREEIIDAFSNRYCNLTDTQYTQIYNYLIYVKENYVIPLLTQESIFKVDPYTLGEMYQTGILIGAIIIIAAGIVFGGLNFLRKKR